MLPLPALPASLLPPPSPAPLLLSPSPPSPSLPPAVPGNVYVSAVVAAMAYESSTERRRALLVTEAQSAQFKAATLSWLADLAPAAPTEDDILVTDNGRVLNATVLVRGQVDLDKVSSRLSGAGFLTAVQQAVTGDQVQFLSPAVVTTDVRQELAPPPPLPASPSVHGGTGDCEGCTTGSGPCMLVAGTVRTCSSAEGNACPAGTVTCNRVAPPPPRPSSFPPPSPPSPPSLPSRFSPPPPSLPPSPITAPLPSKISPPLLPPKQATRPSLPPKQSAQAPPPSPRLPPSSPKSQQMAPLDPEEGGSNQLIQAEDTIIGVAGGCGGLVLVLLAALFYCWRTSRSRKALLQEQRVVAIAGDDSNGVVAIAADGDGPDRSQGIAKAHRLLDRASRQSNPMAMRRQRTLPTGTADVNGCGASEKADLDCCHSFFGKDGSTQNGGGQNDGAENGGAENGGAQNGGDRAWRSFAPGKAEADAIVALCASPTDASLGGAEAPADVPAKASPKLSAATDVLIKMLAEEKSGVQPVTLPPVVKASSSSSSSSLLHPPHPTSPAAATSASAGDSARLPPRGKTAPVYAASSSATHLARSRSVSLVQGGADGAAGGRAKRAPSSVGNMINKFEVQIDQSKPPPPQPPQPPKTEVEPHSPVASNSPVDLVTRSLSMSVSGEAMSVSGEGAQVSHSGAKALLRARLTNETKKAAVLWIEGEQNRWHEEEGKNSPSVEGQDRGSPELAGKAAHDAAAAIESLDADSLQTLLQTQPRSSSSGGPSLISKIAAAGVRRQGSFERMKRREMGDATAPPPTSAPSSGSSRAVRRQSSFGSPERAKALHAVRRVRSFERMRSASWNPTKKAGPHSSAAQPQEGEQQIATAVAAPAAPAAAPAALAAAAPAAAVSDSEHTAAQAAEITQERESAGERGNGAEVAVDAGSGASVSREITRSKPFKEPPRRSSKEALQEP